jgi:hypothetical protein
MSVPKRYVDRLVVYNPDEDDQRTENTPRPTYSNDYSSYNQIPYYLPPSRLSLSDDSDLSPGGSRFSKSSNPNGSSPTQQPYNGESQGPVHQTPQVGPSFLTVGCVTKSTSFTYVG